MRDSIRIVRKMAMADIFSQMEILMKACGRMTKWMVKEDLFSRMAQCKKEYLTKVNLLVIMNDI